MEQQQRKRLDEATKQLAEVVWDSYAALLSNTTAAQAADISFALRLLNRNLELLRAQAEMLQAAGTFHSPQVLADHMRKHREALRELSRDSINAYDSFIDSLSTYYEEALKAEDKPADSEAPGPEEQSFTVEQPRPRLPLFSGKDPTLARRFEEELHGFGE